MNHSAQTSSKEERFSVVFLSDRVNALTEPQKGLLDEAWNHFLNVGTPFPIRGVARIAGKQSVQHVLEGLSGGLIFEVSEQGKRCLQLTLHGALLSGYPLLTGDGKLRKPATKDGIQVFGVLWLLDQIVTHALIPSIRAADALEAMLQHGARLPQAECHQRLQRWRGI